MFYGMLEHRYCLAFSFTSMYVRLQLKCDGTCAETRFRLSASVHSTTGSRGVHVNGSNAGYTMFRGSVKSTGYPLHSLVSLHVPSRASTCAITFQLDSTTKYGRLRLKSDGTRAETRFLLSAKRASPFKSVGASVQSTTGSRGVRISGSNAGYNMFRGSVKSTGYPLHSPVSPSRPLPCVTG